LAFFCQKELSSKSPLTSLSLAKQKLKEKKLFLVHKV